MRRASCSDVQVAVGVRLLVGSIAEVVRVSDGDTGGEAMLDAWTEFGLGGGSVIGGGKWWG